MQYFYNSDMWAIGVITYFLLCGYTPFERDSNVDEMNAIIRADYTFDEEYWYGVSDQGIYPYPYTLFFKKKNIGNNNM